MRSNMLPPVFWRLLWVNACGICSSQPGFPLSFNFHFCLHFILFPFLIIVHYYKKVFNALSKKYQGAIYPGIPVEWMQYELLLSLSFLLHRQAQGIFQPYYIPFRLVLFTENWFSPVVGYFYFFFSLIPETSLEDLAPFSGKHNGIHLKTMVLYFQKTFFPLLQLSPLTSWFETPLSGLSQSS